MRLLILFLLFPVICFAAPGSTPSELLEALQTAAKARDRAAIEALVWDAKSAGGERLPAKVADGVLEGDRNGDWAYSDAAMARLVEQHEKLLVRPEEKLLGFLRKEFGPLDPALKAALADPDRIRVVTKKAKVLLVKGEAGWRLVFWEDLPDLAAESSNRRRAMNEAIRAQMGVASKKDEPEGVPLAGALDEAPAKAQAVEDAYDVDVSVAPKNPLLVARLEKSRIGPTCLHFEGRPDEGGTLEMKVTTDANGDVKTLEVVEGPLAKTKWAACMRRKVRRAPLSREQTLTLRFEYTPPSDSSGE